MNLTPRELADSLTDDSSIFYEEIPFIDEAYARCQLDGCVKDEIIPSYDETYLQDFIYEWNRIAWYYIEHEDELAQIL